MLVNWVGSHSGLICLTKGEFFNPYIQRTMTVSMKLENFPIGVDIDYSIWVSFKLIFSDI